jgi:hypothetical protein
MAPREGQRGRSREPAAVVIAVAFEPSRIARDCLVQAYTVAVPVVRRPAGARFISRRVGLTAPEGPRGAAGGGAP